MLVLSYPLTVLPDGSFKKVDDSTEAYAAQEIALMILTEPGERALVPEYGIESIADSNDISEVELNAKLETFLVPAIVTNVEKDYTDYETTRVKVEFDVPASIDDLSENAGEEYVVTEEFETMNVELY